MSFWLGKKVLITGHTGFKGSWLTAWLNQLGANVVGVSLDIPTKPAHFEILDFNNIENFYLDIRNFEELKTLVKQKSPDFVFHLAAQSLVINSYKNPIDTWGTNLMGTVNILESLNKNYSKLKKYQTEKLECLLNSKELSVSKNKNFNR